MVKWVLNIVVISLLMCLISALSEHDAAERMRNCVKPSSYGFCGGTNSRWFYDTTTNKCKSFIYSGCGGNFNRFTSLSECIDYCMHPEIPYDRK